MQYVYIQLLYQYEYYCAELSVSVLLQNNVIESLVLYMFHAFY
jgi:hypothetical protein